VNKEMYTFRPQRPLPGRAGPEGRKTAPIRPRLPTSTVCTAPAKNGPRRTHHRTDVKIGTPGAGPSTGEHFQAGSVEASASPGFPRSTRRSSSSTPSWLAGFGVDGKWEAAPHTRSATRLAARRTSRSWKTLARRRTKTCSRGTPRQQGRAHEARLQVFRGRQEPGVTRPHSRMRRRFGESLCERGLSRTTFEHVGKKLSPWTSRRFRYVLSICPTLVRGPTTTRCTTVFSEVPRAFDNVQLVDMRRAGRLRRPRRGDRWSADGQASAFGRRARTAVCSPLETRGASAFSRSLRLDVSSCWMTAGSERRCWFTLAELRARRGRRLDIRLTPAFHQGSDDAGEAGEAGRATIRIVAVTVAAIKGDAPVATNR